MRILFFVDDLLIRSIFHVAEEIGPDEGAAGKISGSKHFRNFGPRNRLRQRPKANRRFPRWDDLRL